MDLHAADFGVLAPYGNRFAGGVDKLAFHGVPREVLGRDSDPAALQREVVARDATRRVSAGVGAILVVVRGGWADGFEVSRLLPWYSSCAPFSEIIELASLFKWPHTASLRMLK